MLIQSHKKRRESGKDSLVRVLLPAELEFPKILVPRLSQNTSNVNIEGASEFSSYEIELQNRVTQNDVTLRVTNSKSKNKKFHFELLTRSRKIKSYTSSY